MRRRLLVLPLVVGLLGACGGSGPPTADPEPTSTAPLSSGPAGSSGLQASSSPASPTDQPTGIPTASPSPTPKPTKTPRPPFSLTSSAFAAGDPIPAEYTCDGRDVSPPLTIRGAPSGTKAFVLIVRDEDADDFVHWVAVDIPASTTTLPLGAAAGLQGRNAFGKVGYGGPCPPQGSARHRYVFALTALSRTLDLKGAPTADDVDTAIVLAQAGLARVSLTGTYRRP